MGKHEKLTGAQRVARRRAKLRAAGLRPRQYWLPDLRDPKVRAELEADAVMLAAQAGRWRAEEAFAIGGAMEMLETLPPYDPGDETESGSR